MAEVTGPGTTIAGRPTPSARFRVWVAPLRAAASTSTVPVVAAAMTRLRMRNRGRSGSAPGIHSLTSRPVSAIRSNSAALPIGYGRSSPQASTATVSPPAVSAPRCAAESMPNAPPETTVQSRSASP
jgi:hypothetical protein